MREIRLHGSEGGGTELNRSFLPLSILERIDVPGSTAGTRLETPRLARFTIELQTGRGPISFSLGRRYDHNGVL